MRDLINKNKASYNNLEFYLKIMQETGVCIPFFRNTDYLDLKDFKKKELEKDIITLKNVILDTISEIHPNTWVGKAKEISNCAENLSHFHRIYSINYDLLLYWSILKTNELTPKKFIDGMWMSTENNRLKKFSDSNNKVNVYFLHGALHLIVDNQGDTCKIIKNDENVKLKEIISSLKKNYQKSYNSLLILEGTSDEKINIVSNNSYLHKGLQRLCNSKSNLVIYGCSIIDHEKINNDSHIWDSIINSPFQKLYIGLHEDNEYIFANQEKEILNCLKLRCRCSSFDSKNISFFTTKNSELWSNLSH